MLQSVRMTAEEQFAATQKKAKVVLQEKELLQQERAQQVARLKALRLAKQAADEETASRADAKKIAAKKK